MTTLGGFMDPFALIDPSFLDVAGMGGMGDLSGGFGGGGGTRRRATMPADVLETPVRARDACACACGRARACSPARARGGMCVRGDVGSGVRARGHPRNVIVLAFIHCLRLTRACWLRVHGARAQNEFVMMMCVRARARAAAQNAAQRRRCLRPWTSDACLRCALTHAHTHAHAAFAQGHSGRQAGGHQPGD
jgi:hypothetical protein